MFGDREMLSMILKAKHPKEMKAYGRAVRNFDKDKWDGACYEIVKRGNLAKFSQNPELWDYLKTTKSRILVEASRETGSGASVWEKVIPMRNVL